MLFISRNNRLYQSVAHISSVRRYMITCVVCIFLTIGWLYAVYYPLCALNNYYACEHMQLLEKFQQETELRRHIKGLQSSFDTTTRYNDAYKQSHGFNYFKSEWTFIFDAMRMSDLQLKAYTILGVKEKGWYKKEKYHVELVGDCVRFLKFLELIKEAQKMITCSNIVVSVFDTALFQINCDIGIIAIAS